jgi:hypothetical protein
VRANEFVTDGYGEWLSDGTIQLKNMRQGLSFRVGPELAEAVRKRKGWAQVALSEIER